MPRIARGLLGGGIFHVLNRGNHRQMLFRRDEEFAAFLDLLGCSVAKFSVKLWGYCLMGNHWHLVAEVPSTTELSRWVHWLCNRQVRQMHSENVHLGGGHLYQGRYKSFPIQDESYLSNVLRYVEANHAARAAGGTSRRMAVVQFVDGVGSSRLCGGGAAKAHRVDAGSTLA